MGQLSRLVGFDPGRVEVMFSASKVWFLSVLSAGSCLGDDAGVESKAASHRESHGVTSGHIFGDYLLIRIAVRPFTCNFFILFPQTASVNEIFLD